MALKNILMDLLRKVQLGRHIMFPGFEVLFDNLDKLCGVHLEYECSALMCSVEHRVV